MLGIYGAWKMIKEAEEMKGGCNDDGRRNRGGLENMYEGVKYLFSFDSWGSKSRERTWFEQLGWEAVYNNLNESHHQLVVERDK